MRGITKTVTTAQVAAKFGRTVKWLYRRRARLEAEGFPKPLPGTSNRLWAADAVDDWFVGTGAPPAGPSPQSETERIFEQRIEAMLAGRS